MNVTIKFMGALKEARGSGECTVEVEDDATVAAILTGLGIKSDEVQIVMRNGRPAPDRSVACAEGDELTLVPPVGGG